MQQTVHIELGENPPEVTVTSIILGDLFVRASGDQFSSLFKVFMAIAVHMARGEGSLKALLEENGLGDQQIPDELQPYFEEKELTDVARAALELLMRPENSESSDLGFFLNWVSNRV